MLSLAAAAVALLLADIDPETVAKVQHDRDKAMADINKKYGDRKSSELSQDERRDMIADQQAADQKVLEKNRVDAKEMARYEATMSLDERAAAKAAKEKLVEKDKKDAEAKKKAAEDPKGNREIPIQRGFSDNNPVTLEEKGSGPDGIVVEKGLPSDAVDDYKAAGQAADDSSAAPAKSGKSNSGKDK